MSGLPSKRVSESLSKILRSIAEEGMVVVAQRSELSTLDKGLLKSLVGLGGLKGSEELLEILTENPEVLETPQAKKYKISGLNIAKEANTKDTSEPETKEEKSS